MLNNKEDDYLQLSGIQHFAFCRRQWALIHIEGQWHDNLRTVEGNILHERVHDDKESEFRKNTYTVRGMRVQSAVLGVSGTCDLVEFVASDDGVPLFGREGKWLAYPVEYKRGNIKVSDADRLQLCCQAMCLEEMLCCHVSHGAIYYGEIRHREKTEFSDELRAEVVEMLNEMHGYMSRGYTPKVKTGSRCRSCSLCEICLPSLSTKTSAAAYLKASLEREDI